MSDEMAESSDAALREAQLYWDKRASESSTDCERVEQSRRTQRTRFEAFLKLNDIQQKSILDVGCGAGDLWGYLSSKTISCEYEGFDISAEMVKRCKERFPDVTFNSGDFLHWRPNRKFDYTIAIGIHNIRIAGGWEMFKETTRKQFELCRIASHISILTDRYVGFAPHIQAWKAENVLAMALEITPYVCLRHDYLPNDFSVTLYRQPLIDTINIDLESAV